jgi:hypothetical protein
MDLTQHAKTLLPVVDAQLAGLMKQIGALEQQRLALDAEAETLRNVATSLRDLLNSPQYTDKRPEANGQSAMPEGMGRLRTRDALLTVMKAEPGRSRKPSGWLVKLVGRGWIDPRMEHRREAVRAALNKLVDGKSGVERVPGTTLYLYRPPEEVTAVDNG